MIKDINNFNRIIKKVNQLNEDYLMGVKKKKGSF